MKLETIIGLETHIQLKTDTKMFCGCSNLSEDAKPNTNICPICLGHPGTLPVVNKEAIIMGIKAALQIGCRINRDSQFDRKNYSYPDLPKGYQISQFKFPIGYNGLVTFFARGKETSIRIERLHLEEDAAKLVHPANADYSLVDFNRGGSPLAEIVTRPDLRSAADAKAYLQELRLMMRQLGVTDADMEKGHLRCDANISLRPVGEDILYAKTEIKNLNSYRAVERALLYEEFRQKKLWEKGTPNRVLTTRGWDESAQKTYEQRTKEEAQDYRYFPEPDIPPLTFKEKCKNCNDIPFDEIHINCLASDLPETPYKKTQRFIEQYAFSMSDARTLVEDRELSAFAENTMTELKQWLSEEGKDEVMEEDDSSKKKLGKLVGGWMTTEIVKWLHKEQKKFSDIELQAQHFAQLLGLVIERRITSNTAQSLLPKMIKNQKSPADLMEETDHSIIESEDELSEIVLKIIKANPSVLADYKKGKENSIKFFIGQVMRETGGRANPVLTKKIITRLLKKL